MNLPQLNIGDKTTKVPIIQGGMGVGVSLSSLASAVANSGGIGIISGVQIGFKEDDFDKNTNEANERALAKEIRKARNLSPDGIIGVNLMVAIKNYDEMVKIAVEGPDAGGHLGFSFDELEGDDYPNLEDIVKDVIKSIKPFEESSGKKIPVIAAGGIFDGEDISRFLNLGASGVQMGTRFVATEECDASIEFKNAYVKAKEKDIQFILSPVGMPGQAIVNPFIKRVKAKRERIAKCYNCLTPCNPAKSPYCISQALINSVNGDVDNGLIFIGKQGYRIDRIVSVKELMDELVTLTLRNI